MKKVIIVGAGVAGLSAAIYAQRSGFSVTLIEQHSIVGGMCTSWRRKGYLFEGAIHWMTGSSPKTAMYELWKDTGALGDNVNVLLSDPFYSVEHDGQILCLYRDIKKTVETLCAISPADEANLKQLEKEVIKLSKMQMPIYDIKGVKSENPKQMSFRDIMKMLPLIPTMNRLNKISCAEYADRFQHPGIKRLMKFLMEKYDAASFIFTLATLHIGDGGCPEGGSLPMVHRMAQTFKDLGGTLILNTKVQKVNLVNGKATGVTLENEVLDADAVIVTQETIAALDNLFDEAPNDSWLLDLRQSVKPAVCTFISVGIKAKIPATPDWVLKEPIKYAGQIVNNLGFYNYSGYEGYAPSGCTTLTTGFMSDTYDFWKEAKENGRYDEEKELLAEQIKKAICQKYPQAEGKIEVVDIATPLTYERYTSAYRGSWMGITEPGYRMKQYPGYCESVEGLYFAGHRMTPPGGLPVALMSGRQAAQMVCRQFDVVFK